MPRRIPPFLFRSVRGRLVLLVAALVLPVVALAGAMVFQAYRNERASVATTLLSTTRAVSRVVDGEIEKADTLARTFAASNAIARDDLVALNGSAQRALAGDPRWLVVVSPNGQQLLNTRLAPGSSLPKVEFEPDLLAAVAKGERYLSNLRVSRTTAELVVHVSRGHFRNGELKYVLTISIPPRTFADAIGIDRYAPGKIVTVADRKGMIVARSRNPDKFVGGSATPDMVTAMTTRREGVVDSVTLEHIPVLTAFSHADCGWATLIGAPKAELYVSAQRLLVWGIVGAITLILVAIAMTVWIGRAVVHGVDVLARDAETIGGGAIPATVSTGLDETEFVADAMRRTSKTLWRRTNTLEVLNRIATTLVAERDVEKIVQSVTDAGRELTGAEAAAFFYQSEPAEPSMLYSVSGASRAAFDRLQRDGTGSRLDPLFLQQGVWRVDDVAADPRLAALAATARTPAGIDALAIRSLLIVALKSRTGSAMGGMVFVHADAGVFTAEAERIAVGLAAEAAIAIDNAKLYHALARELAAKSKAEAELRHAQQRLSDHARELERKVEQRTASLQDAVTQMEEFSYTVSHDLRSPLRAMHAFADALLEDYGPKLDDTARDYLHRIQRASRRMDQLTTDLLGYSRIARDEVQLAPTDVEQIVRATIEHYDELHPSRADIRIASPLERVLAHAPSLSQCVANLLTNAAKFVKPGERPQIVVRTETIGDRVRLWVEDRGIGIKPDYQAKLFRIFERAPNSRGYEGTGVGLAIVRRASEKMGGSCGVISDGNDGTRFWIELAKA